MSASSCGGLDMLNGGAITNSTIINSQVANSSIQGSEFTSGTITGSTIVSSTLTSPNINGGNITGATIAGSTLTEPTINQGVSNSTKLVGSSIESLAKIDDTSAELIANAIAYLPAEKLAALANAILSQYSQPSPGTISSDDLTTSTGETITTTCFGSSDTLLGKPGKWVGFGGGAVPVYTTKGD